MQMKLEETDITAKFALLSEVKGKWFLYALISYVHSSAKSHAVDVPKDKP